MRHCWHKNNHIHTVGKEAQAVDHHRHHTLIAYISHRKTIMYMAARPGYPSGTMQEYNDNNEERMVMSIVCTKVRPK